MRILTSDTIKNSTLDKLSRDDKGVSRLLALLNQQDEPMISLKGTLVSKLPEGIKVNLETVGVIDLPYKGDISSETPIEVVAERMDNAIKLSIKPLMPEVRDVENGMMTPSSKQVAAKWLAQLNLPVSEPFVEAVELLNQYKVEPSAERIKLLADGSFLALKLNQFEDKSGLPEQLASAMKNIINEGMQPETATLKTVIKALLNVDPKALNQPSENTKIEANGLELKVASQKIEVREGSVPSAKVATVEGLDNHEVEASTAIDNKARPLSVEGAVKQLVANFEPKQLLSLIKSDGISLKQLVTNYDQFFSADRLSTAKHKVIENLKTILADNQLTKKSEIQLLDWLKEDDRAFSVKSLASLETIMAQSDVKMPAELKDALEVLVRAAQLQDKLPDGLNYIQMPIKLNQEDTQLDVFYNKKRSKNKEDAFKMLLALNTNTFGMVQVLITDTPQKTQVQFKLASETVQNTFDSGLDGLMSMLESWMPKSIELSTELQRESTPVLEAMSSLLTEASNAFDVRV